VEQPADREDRQDAQDRPPSSPADRIKDMTFQPSMDPDVVPAPEVEHRTGEDGITKGVGAAEARQSERSNHQAARTTADGIDLQRFERAVEPGPPRRQIKPLPDRSQRKPRRHIPPSDRQTLRSQDDPPTGSDNADRDVLDVQRGPARQRQPDAHGLILVSGIRQPVDRFEHDDPAEDRDEHRDPRVVCRAREIGGSQWHDADDRGQNLPRPDGPILAEPDHQWAQNGRRSQGDQNDARPE
jgi:hypothetical protein